MRQRLSMVEIKARKQRYKCPSCGSELERFMFKEDGEEFEGKKCKKYVCSWWGL